VNFFLETLVSGLLAGVMYSLVAIGFVLIYKASGVFNFAQGSILLFAALTFVSLTERGAPSWLALAIINRNVSKCIFSLTRLIGSDSVAA
jgi:branched-subunit amino acid ABC-type transport system permease component